MQVECSGHGECERQPILCRASDACVALCSCESGWAGDDCATSADVMASIVQLRSEHLQLQAQSLSTADLNNPAAVSQQAQTLASIAKADQLVPASRNTVLSIVDTLVSASRAQDSQM